MLCKKSLPCLKGISLNQLAPLVLYILLFSTLLFCQPKENSVGDVEKHIEVKSITQRISLIKLGNDAIYSVETPEGVGVIDAGISNSLTSLYRKTLEHKLNRNDIAYLINTHSHWDHTGGNQVFSDAVIIGHINCVKEINDYWKEREKIKSRVLKIISNYENQLNNIDPEWQDSLQIFLQKERYRFVSNDLNNDRIITLPSKTFIDTMDLSIGDIRVHLKYFGKAHSNSDILVYIPEEKVLFVGDLFMKFGKPSFSEVDAADIRKWVSAKNWLNNRLENIDIVLGGHGQIMDKNDLLSFIEYINSVIKKH